MANLRPLTAEAWQDRGDRAIAAGDRAGGDAAHCHAVAASVHDSELIDAAMALAEARLAVAERILRPRLKRRPTDVAAMRMLAELAGRLGRYRDAETLLRRALDLAPSFREARFNLATILHRRTRSAEALDEIARLLALDPGNPSYRNLRAAALARLGDFDAALAVYADLLADHPRQPKGWMSYGHALKTVGRQAEAIAAYREAIAQAPALGEAYWSLANLKTVAFSDEDVAAMTLALADARLAVEDRLHLHFALGKALGDRGDPAASFAQYVEGNAIRAGQLKYDAAETTAAVARARAFFTAEMFAARAGQGDPATDPIFIIGMPRSGSTLIEQILSSHPAVEGTSELPDIPALAWQVGERDGASSVTGYPEALATADLAALGADYLARAKVQRKTARPRFIDKLPNNWLHAGMIRLILPNATIIDARRSPMACGWSNFTQHFARGQGFSYSLADMGAYYRDYVGLMDHFDAAQPGAIHRLDHEALVADSEREVRRLLDYCGLDFDPACLRFWETERAIRTPSSEQVRRPISAAGLDQWRVYDQWLGPLREALGPLAD
ncbi:sulfotransferase [Polymorphobacter sp. PAMC 29334]|uniref:tetratricopeptide repeat-containing sulfotransferase family protein n=1 Tax=Polymorphobacter sp. PAMC 29334 TaxID=2862331 RepID=UPI001C760ADF|nr:tetratricopeptide repeat-containing sulfotransferase family protein [Polymorphobacter sp. PAMC 29334]QYE34627.1 sulfotransferase [Polymorphobacter sp. PAMC 29334]